MHMTKSDKIPYDKCSWRGECEYCYAIVYKRPEELEDKSAMSDRCDLIAWETCPNCGSTHLSMYPTYREYVPPLTPSQELRRDCVEDKSFGVLVVSVLALLLLALAGLASAVYNIISQ